MSGKGNKRTHIPSSDSLNTIKDACKNSKLEAGQSTKDDPPSTSRLSDARHLEAVDQSQTNEKLMLVAKRSRKRNENILI